LLQFPIQIPTTTTPHTCLTAFASWATCDRLNSFTQILTTGTYEHDLDGNRLPVAVKTHLQMKSSQIQSESCIYPVSFKRKMRDLSHTDTGIHPRPKLLGPPKAKRKASQECIHPWWLQRSQPHNAFILNFWLPEL
jgi:hypothetical protein